MAAAPELCRPAPPTDGRSPTNGCGPWPVPLAINATCRRAWNDSVERKPTLPATEMHSANQIRYLRCDRALDPPFCDEEWGGEHSGRPRSGLGWADVPRSLTAQALVGALRELGAEIALDLARRVLADAPSDRPQPQLAHACAEHGVYRFWAFGATVELVSDTSRDARAPDSRQDQGAADLAAIRDAVNPERACAVILQPVEILVSDCVVMTCRQRGIRFPIGDVDDPVTLAAEIDFERVRSNARNCLRASLRGAPCLDRDLLLYSIIEALVTTLFDARTALSNTKIVLDEEYFAGLVQSRKRAASSDLGSDQVARVARDATYLIDHTRRALGSIQHTVVVFRQWFDDLKPPGLPDKSAIWLPDTTQPSASQHLVERIYQVRNDLRRVRNEVGESMALLANADTGGELLAVRALLDRTESARAAAIVAGSVTVLLGAVVLSATVAAIPAHGARFDPIARAFGFAGVSVLTATMVGIAAAFLSRRPAPPSNRRWAVFSGTLFLTALVALILALTSVAAIHTASLTAGLACGVGALLVAAYAGEFGSPLRGSPAVAAVAALMAARPGPFYGSADDLAAQINSISRAARRRFRRGADWMAASADWVADPQVLVAAVVAERALIEQQGYRVTVHDGARRMLAIDRVSA